MNMELQTKLDSIKADCRRAIALGEGATDGPWHPEIFEGDLEWRAWIPAVDGRPHQTYTICSGAWNIGDSRFIAFSRAFTPAAAQVLLVAIEALEIIARHDHCNATGALGDLERIAAEWPEGAK